LRNERAIRALAIQALARQLCEKGLRLGSAKKKYGPEGQARMSEEDFWVITPAVAAAKIVDTLCGDLPMDRRLALIEAIDAAMSAWGLLTASVEMEGQRG
jgi:hypothetical protein